MAHTISRRALSVLASLLLLGGLFASCAKQSPLSFDQMRERYYLTLVPDADLSDTLVQRRINALDDAAGPFWKSLNKAPDRGWLWEENKDTTVSMMMGGNFAKLNTLAAAYRTKGSRYYGNPEMKADILAGLDWAIANRYNPSVEWYDNWWDWVIGVPMTLNNTLVLMYDDLSPEQLRAALGAMDHFAPDVTYEGAATGANKIWQCGIMAVRGILGQNPDQLKMAVDGLGTEFKYVTGKDGFYEDGSFVQHQWHPYTGGYGRSMLSQMADLIALLSDTPWAVPQPYEAMLYEWIHNGYEPLVYRGAMMDMVRGREISRPGCTDRWAGHSILVSMLRLSEVAPAAEKERLQAFVKANVLSDDNRDFMQDVPTYLLASARALMADGEVKPEAPQTLNKVFGAMDRAVHKRPGFALGIAMSSNRIENYETINGENLCAWYTGDGMTYLYDNDLAQYSDSFWPTVNPYRMAGTTEDTRVREAKTLPFGPGLLYADGYKSPQHWVGGSSIEGRYGMAGMWYDAQDCTLEAKKKLADGRRRDRCARCRNQQYRRPYDRNDRREPQDESGCGLPPDARRRGGARCGWRAERSLGALGALCRGGREYERGLLVPAAGGGQPPARGPYRIVVRDQPALQSERADYAQLLHAVARPRQKPQGRDVCLRAAAGPRRRGDGCFRRSAGCRNSGQYPAGAGRTQYERGRYGFQFLGGCRPGGRGERRCARVGDRARDARNDYRRRERSDAPEYGCGSCDALRGEGRKGGGGASRSEGGVALARRARSGYGRFSGPHPQRYAPEIGGCPLRYMGRRESAAESDCRSCRA